MLPLVAHVSVDHPGFLLIRHEPGASRYEVVTVPPS
jgi:hypothetical protein